MHRPTTDYYLTFNKVQILMTRAIDRSWEKIFQDYNIYNQDFNLTIIPFT